MSCKISRSGKEKSYMYSSILWFFWCGFFVLPLPLPNRMLPCLLPALGKWIPAVLAIPWEFSGIGSLLEFIRFHARYFQILSTQRGGLPGLAALLFLFQCSICTVTEHTESPVTHRSLPREHGNGWPGKKGFSCGSHFVPPLLGKPISL